MHGSTSPKSNDTTRPKTREMAQMLVTVWAIASSVVFSRFLRIEPSAFVLVACLCITVPISHLFCTRWNSIKKSKFVLCAAGIFSFALALSIVAGYHINLFSDSLDQFGKNSFVTSYSFLDLVALIVMSGSLFGITAVLLSLAKDRGAANVSNTVDLSAVPLKTILVGSVFLFLLWLPYLLTYWPGFLLGDSLSSVRQALGMRSWDNHFPVAYTALIAFFLKISHLCGFGNSVGCALYSVFQMLFMAIALSFCTNWVAIRGRLSRIWTVVMLMVFGLTPYFASFSIAMWKDPIFSSALVMMTLLLFDFSWKKGVVGQKWYAFMFVFCLISVFFRGNGLVVAALVAAALVLAAFHARREGRSSRPFLKASTTILIACVIQLAATGPLYGFLGIAPAEPIESRGLFMNQLARVVIAEGDISDQEYAYLDEILPIGSYADAYTPTIVDSIKWHDEFNDAAIDNRFLSVWASVGLKNPRLYLEGWELQTCGYWAINVPEINNSDWNIEGGLIYNIDESRKERLNTLDLHPRNLLGFDFFYKLFPSSGWFVPVSWINWLVLFLMLALATQQRTSLILGLAPIVGLAATLLIASPLWYWPRYAAAEHMLIPVLILLLIIVFRKRINELSTV